jgi:DHA2 family multidrug resistance protein
MTAFRVLQGFTGGDGANRVRSGFYAVLGQRTRAHPAILGVVSVLAPTLDPVSGLITDAIDWRWIFFVNVIPGIAVTGLAAWLIRTIARICRC